MLYYQWNLLDGVNTPHLQHSILTSGLVNWQGKPNLFKPINLGLEHLNVACKINMKVYKNSTHNINITFDHLCLSNNWMCKLQEVVEDRFSQPMKGDHTSHSAELEIFSLA